MAEAIENLLAHESLHTPCEIGCGSGVELALFARMSQHARGGNRGRPAAGAVGDMV